MRVLPDALAPMGQYDQFLLYKAVPLPTGKIDKIPLDYRTMAPAAGVTAGFSVISSLLPLIGPGYGVGFYFTERDPFFFLDIDDCAIPGGWSPQAMTQLSYFPGAAVEVSVSGKGLHVFGIYHGEPPAHCCDNKPMGSQFFTERRFVALTGTGAIGRADLDCTDALFRFVGEHFPTKQVDRSEWTDTPCAGWNGPVGDEDLIKKALASKSTASVFGGGASSFKALWNADEEELGKRYPDQRGRAYDASQADAALAQHLAFWTGNNCERIEQLMRLSGLMREKWDMRGEYYLNRTILRAVGLQKTVCGGPKLRGSKEHVAMAQTIITNKGLAIPTGPSPGLDAKFWINNRDKEPEELETMLEVAPVVNPFIESPEVMQGFQFMGDEEQIRLFKGCVYIQDIHRIFVPSGSLLKPEQFNATYGGYVFSMDDSGAKTTRKAFEAFTESQLVHQPKAESSCFRPSLDPGAIVKQYGKVLVNTYVPAVIPRQQGDVSRFLNHMGRVLPDPNDRAILLAYMAACVQYKGVKFQWAPLIQGAPGNGKSLFTYCMVAAIGRQYSHIPPASEIGEKFNSWLFQRLFVGVEDIYIPEQKRELAEILKPMITGDWGAMRAMQRDQVMGDICCNFIFNSNHKDAVRKTSDDRRFCVFYSAQQTAEDIQRDGMGGSYFPDIYDWLKNDGGYAVVTEFLHTYPIPDHLNPAGKCHRAPVTSTTHEAIASSMGGIEQEVLEAVDEGRPGFAGGWISSMFLERLLKEKRKDNAMPLNKRREMLRQLGYVPHPHLTGGRVSHPVAPDGGKPRLFIRVGSPHTGIVVPKEISEQYAKDQLTNVFV